MLVAGNIQKNIPHGPDDTHCLLGWAGTCFNKGDAFDWVIHVIRNVIRQELQRNYPYVICDFASDLQTPKELIARVWNRAMYLVGYTSGNPENQPLSKRMT